MSFCVCFQSSPLTLTVLLCFAVVLVRPEGISFPPFLVTHQYMVTYFKLLMSLSLYVILILS